MDSFDGAAAFVATLCVIAFIAVSRRNDAEERRYGRSSFLTTCLLFGLLGFAAYGFFFHIDHPFWGDVLASVSGGFAALALAFLADHLRRFLKGEPHQ